MEKQKKFGIVLGIIILAILFIFLIGSKKSASPVPVNNVGSDLPSLVGIQTTTAPWTSGGEGLRERLKEIGEPALSMEGSALHIHQHIDVYIKGEKIGVPARIGIGFLDSFISSIHTHDITGVIHVESPTIKDFTLGQFFDVWGVKFSAQSIGGYNSDEKNKIQIFVDGKEETGDPRAVVLSSHQEIVVAFGTAEELPKIIPSSYKFSENE